jgi:hypothetical protein
MDIILIVILMLILFILAWALFGKDETVRAGRRAEESDALLRRRSTDREIEKLFPGDRIQKMRRKSDLDVLEDGRAMGDEFKLPYRTAEIISEASRFRIYLRTIANAEIYAQKGDFNTAVSLYEGVNNRIKDSETNHKIEANIDYIRRYRQYLSVKKRKEEEITAPPVKKSREIRLSVDGPLSIPDKIQIGLTTPYQPLPFDVEKVTDEITRKLKDKNIIPDIERLENKIDQLVGRKGGPEDLRQPTIIEAKYESPVPLILDPKPILDLLDRIPSSERAKAARERAEKDGAAFSEEYRKETVSRKEEEEPDEWDLLSRYGRDEKTPEEGMSDEDIFAKLIAGDTKKTGDNYEILGDSRPEEEYLDITDRETMLQRNEDERFYNKFLKHHRRKVKELPILKVSYDFSKLPDEFSLGKEKNILEYSYYKYKAMLERAQEYIKRRKVKDAINYYKVVMSQNIPPEFKSMIRKNIGDLTEYLEKYLSTD